VRTASDQRIGVKAHVVCGVGHLKWLSTGNDRLAETACARQGMPVKFAVNRLVRRVIAMNQTDPRERNIADTGQQLGDFVVNVVRARRVPVQACRCWTAVLFRPAPGRVIGRRGTNLGISIVMGNHGGV